MELWELDYSDKELAKRVGRAIGNVAYKTLQWTLRQKKMKCLNVFNSSALCEGFMVPNRPDPVQDPDAFQTWKTNNYKKIKYLSFDSMDFRAW